MVFFPSGTRLCSGLTQGEVAEHRGTARTTNYVSARKPGCARGSSLKGPRGTKDSQAAKERLMATLSHSLKPCTEAMLVRKRLMFVMKIPWNTGEPLCGRVLGAARAFHGVPWNQCVRKCWEQPEHSMEYHGSMVPLCGKVLGVARTGKGMGDSGSGGTEPTAAVRRSTCGASFQPGDSGSPGYIC